MVKTLFLVLLTTALVNNVVLSQFLGICPFIGVSKNTKTAAGMGGAVIFVITLSSAVASLLYTFVLEKLNLTYLNTIVFIMVIAFVTSVVTGFGTAVGFCIAIIIMAGVREKTENNNFPKSFKGTPAVLMTACLMSIAFYGFTAFA